MKQTLRQTIVGGFLFIIAASCFAQNKSHLEYPESSGIVIEKYNEETIENLAVLCKTWGFLKYYHPRVSMGHYNMDAELFRVMPKVLKAKSKKDRNNILDKWIASFGDVKVWDSVPVFEEGSVKVYPDLKWLEDTSDLGKMSERLLKIKDAERSSDTTHYVIFPYGPSAFMWRENQYKELSSLDTGYRLAGLFRLWNGVQYYFAYKYLIDGDWNEILKEYIPQIIDTDGGLGYKLTVLKMITRLEDSHARILHPTDGSNPRATHPDLDKWEGLYTIPFEITFVEDKAVITDKYPTKEELNTDYPFKIGDVVLTVNDESVEDIIKRKVDYTPASHYVGKLKKIATSLLRSHDNKIAIRYERDGEILSREFDAHLLSEIEVPNRTRKDLPAYTAMDNGIAYIYLGSTRGGSLPDHFDESTKGIIIDLRSFPNSIQNYWGYFPLFPNPVLYAYCSVPSIAYPGTFAYSGGVVAARDNPDYYKGKKVLLINEYTQSQPEFLAMQYGCAPNTILIGSKTTGADGNVSVLSLPGFEIMFSGVGVYYPDGRETQRVGILPDIEVKPTIKGVREGRDEVLERAVEYILND